MSRNSATARLTRGRQAIEVQAQAWESTLPIDGDLVAFESATSSTRVPVWRVFTRRKEPGDQPRTSQVAPVEPG